MRSAGCDVSNTETFDDPFLSLRELVGGKQHVQSKAADHLKMKTSPSRLHAAPLHAPTVRIGGIFSVNDVKRGATHQCSIFNMNMICDEDSVHSDLKHHTTYNIVHMDFFLCFKNTFLSLHGKSCISNKTEPHKGSDASFIFR